MWARCCPPIREVSQSPLDADSRVPGGCPWAALSSCAPGAHLRAASQVGESGCPSWILKEPSPESQAGCGDVSPAGPCSPDAHCPLCWVPEAPQLSSPHPPHPSTPYLVHTLPQDWLRPKPSFCLAPSDSFWAPLPLAHLAPNRLEKAQLPSRPAPPSTQQPGVPTALPPI